MRRLAAVENSVDLSGIELDGITIAASDLEAMARF
jgi:hypothetical protein